MSEERSGYAVEAFAAEEPAKTPSFADIADIEETTERPTETKEFVCKGRKMLFTIYSDGADRADLWRALLSAKLWAQDQKTISALEKKPFSVSVRVPYQESGQRKFKAVNVSDTDYLGSMRTLSVVLKEPNWSFDEVLVAGHKLGKEFLEVCQWAEQVNGISSYFTSLYLEAKKNLPETAEA